MPPRSRRINLPVGGVSNDVAYHDQKHASDGGVQQVTVPFGSLENFRVIDPLSERPRGGTRPALDLAISNRIGVGPVQAFETIAKASVRIGVDAGALRDLVGGLNRNTDNADAVDGNLFLLDRAPSLTREIDWIPATIWDDSAADIAACAVSPDGTKLGVAMNRAGTQLTVTDGACVGGGSLILTSATGGFTSGMVGLSLGITGGTLTAGVYTITGFTDTNTVTLDSSPAPGAPGSGSTVKVERRMTIVRVYTLPALQPLAGWTDFVLGAGGVEQDESYTNQMVWAGDDTLCCAMNQFVVCLNMTGNQQAINDCRGWADEVVDLCAYKDSGGQWWLYACFLGSSRSDNWAQWDGTWDSAYPHSSGTPTGAWAAANDFYRHLQHTRSGVMKFKVAPDLQPQRWGALTETQVTDNGALWEVDHGYFRFAEQEYLIYQTVGDGRVPTAIACDPDGNVVVSTTNKGYGSIAVDTTLGRKCNLWKIRSNGVLAWIADTQSNQGGEDNDIITAYRRESDPAASFSDPMINAAVIDNNGDVFVGGRVNDAGYNIFKFDGVTGSLIAVEVLDTSGNSIRQGAMAYDANEGVIYAGGDRSTTWTGSSGANAHIWALDSQVLTIVKTFDLGAAVSCLCVAAAGDGNFVYGTDHF